jgi:sulfoxide reductase catalytic subunit YedY
MLIKPPSDTRSSEITDKKHYLNRREFIRATAGTAAAAAAGMGVLGGTSAILSAQQPAPHGQKFADVKKSPLSITTEKQNSWNEITTYNNYYEFGTDKDSPAALAQKYLKPSPWTVSVEGECNKPAKYHMEDILKGQALEERVYRHRCVEAWSLVIPWIGFPLSDFIKKCEPNSKAKFVEFTTLLDTGQMPGARVPVLDWPYVEALRLDEAMHPLTIFVVGLYGEMLPNQDGAPLRLAVPWKYGFKHIKSIVKVKFTATQPKNTWQISAPSEYGFYANVNPMVDHPRWSQATERRIGEFLKRKTLMFNGYADQVASMYTGLDLKKNY